MLRDILKLNSCKIREFFTNPKVQKTLGVLFFFSITIAILFSNFSPHQLSLKPDEVATRDIQSNVTAVVIDEKKTAELKAQAASKVQKVYQEDNFALSNAKEEVDSFYTSLSHVLNSEAEDKEQKIKQILEGAVADKDFKPEFSYYELARYILQVGNADLAQIHQASWTVIYKTMQKPITEEALPATLEQVKSEIDALPYTAQAKAIIKITVAGFMRPNMIYNKEATEKAIKEATDAVQPVQKTIKAGEIIVREGDRVTEEQISILEQLGLQKSKSYPLTLVGAGIFVLITFWLIIEFLRRYYKHIYDSSPLLLLIGLIFILILLITRFLTIIKIGAKPELNSLMGYAAPVAAGSMLIAILLDNRLAYFITMIMALYVGLLTEGNQLFYAIVAFVGGTVGVFKVYKLSQTSDLAKAGIYVALADIITIITLIFISGNISLSLVFTGIAIGTVNGLLSAVLMIGALPYLETAFSITSMIKLLELSNPNHYLLRRLLLEAPSTYHHSLLVGNLAEAAAEAIGANSLLVRVGAYYHDIGKLKRPEYFIENQRGGENPHEKIAPALSALIITSHVKEGLELAREAKLPRVIMDFIEQHHGTSLARYFYSRALEEHEQISEESFRYEGPKPQSKEVALVMLADSVEAAVRSLSDPTPENIEQMVHKVIKEKLDDGQLDLCELTFRDLNVAAEAFCKVLDGIYHKRIEYPENIARELKGSELDGDCNNK
ncbi:HDIG domain-containing metalloprotein [Thermosyntropha sp.]|uniref:HD family phosphohydrolase n=1 Tax=Thermosyntropha sp. TaxID=2740820 RepID=UPI0025D467C5|nr:HDIG domain-containing metalloprotein [Thermosyntropha sp.]MBO8158675.1 HDIG domain-containing protein [Thermosyntropha sp.]